MAPRPMSKTFSDNGRLRKPVLNRGSFMLRICVAAVDLNNGCQSIVVGSMSLRKLSVIPPKSTFAKSANLKLSVASEAAKISSSSFWTPSSFLRKILNHQPSSPLRSNGKLGFPFGKKLSRKFSIVLHLPCDRQS